MKTVSNSVRVMAPGGQTSRQLAFLQCLQTSLIISQACPPAMGVGCTSVPRLSGTCSMNCTCRQFCASSWPVLSKESARNCGLLPSSWFHSLHATSQALQPMQIDVSVKNPIGRSWNAAIPLEPHQIARDLGVAAFGGDQIERQRRELVDCRDGARVLTLIDRDEVAPAHLARVDPKVREEVHVRENRYFRTRRLVAVEPGFDQPLEVGFVKTKQSRLTQGLSARGDRRLHDPGQRRANDIGHEVVAIGAIGPRSLECALLRIDDGEVERERLLCKVEARAELACALAALLVRR